MSKEVDKLLKKYYRNLIVLLVIYVIGVIVLGGLGIFNIKSNIIALLIISALYYLIVKNSLAKYYKRKIDEISPKKEKVDKGENQDNISHDENSSSDKEVIEEKEKTEFRRKEKIKWYKSPTFLYIIIMLIIAIIYRKLI